MNPYFRDLYKTLIGQSFNNQMDKLTNFIKSHTTKFSFGVFRLRADGSGVIYNASGEQRHQKDIEFNSIKELKKLINKK